MYNYERFNLWQTILHFCLVCFSIISLLNLFVINKVPLLVALFSMWGLLLGSGFFI
jgi:hypothetical protein